MSIPRLRTRDGHVINLRPLPKLPYDQDADMPALSVRMAWQLLISAGLTHELPAVRDAARALDAHVARRPLFLPSAAVAAPGPVPVSGMTVERARGHRPGGDAA